MSALGRRVLISSLQNLCGTSQDSSEESRGVVGNATTAAEPIGIARAGSRKL